MVVNLITTIPALGLFSQQASNDANYLLDPDFFRNQSAQGPAGLPLLLGILAYGALLAVVLGILLLTCAAWFGRTMPIVLVWTSLFLFLRPLAHALVDGLKYDARWRLLDLWNSLSLLGQALLGFEHHEISPSPQPEFWEAVLVLGGVCCACLMLLYRRMKSFEVVRST